MLGARKVSSVVTGSALLFQTLFLPLATSAQTSRNFLVRVCVPPDLVKNSWTYPYPGSEMDAFKNHLRNYILVHGDRRVQYRIKDNGFEIFSRARRASAPYTPDPRNLLEEASAEQACPPTNFTNTLEVGPDNNSPKPPAQPPPVQDSVSSSPQASAPQYWLAPKDDVQLRCDQLAESPDDPTRSGPGVPLDRINTREAHSVCEQAATRQAWRARYQLLFGRVLEAEGDLRQAAKWYTAAGDTGSPEAYVNLGYLYTRSQPPDYAAAANSYKKAVRSGSAKGALMLGWLYQVGKGVRQNPAEAIRLYTDAGNHGQTDAMYRLGAMYEQGDGVQKDPAAAAKWFYEAGRRGHPYAQEELGWMFATGMGVSKPNHRAAFAWFLPAAEAGLVNSQVAVAAMYDDGDVVPRNASEAVKWYRKGAAQNQVFAMYKLGIHLRLGDGVSWSESEAMQWFKRAADQGYAPAQYSLGYGYEHGLGQAVGQGVQDYHQAADWLEKAARQGEAYAQVDLGLLYESGRGVERDLQQARALYVSASRSTIPKVAEFARKFLANLPDSSQDRAARSSRMSTEWMAPVVFGLGILALASFFSGPSSSGGSGGAPDIGSYPTSAGSDWPTSTPEVRTPECHQVPMGFSTPNGLELSNPTAGGVPTRLECN